MAKNYFLCDKNGIPKALLHPTSAAMMIADGYGTWQTVTVTGNDLVVGNVGYVMKVGRTFMAFRLNLYFIPGDYLIETNEELRL
jgi:hypothetical protein